ncbi:hypothetical protein V493_07957 [Pseudogymnoascus sp. VKM F-4281 (FW-2241)]|nr:hypothetical protein V493_07957 [Pseudogymnoascus sp. VKM F-4281 (FW-2241)]
MDANTPTPAGPEPLKHPLYHYWKTTKKGRIIESWVMAKDSEGKTLWMVDLVNPKTGARKRKIIRKISGLVRIASGGARMEGGEVKNEGGEAGEGEEEEGERKKKKKKKKCVVM